MKCHVKYYLAISHIKLVLLPEEGQYVNFENFKKLIKAPFIIFGDFGCVLIPSTNNIYFRLNTKKYKDHIVCSYIYKLICVDGRYSKPYKTNFGEDAIAKFLNDMIKESEYCSRVTEIEFNKPVAD